MPDANLYQALAAFIWHVLTDKPHNHQEVVFRADCPRCQNEKEERDAGR
jgi:hypothetical protein